jgi:hypothetical protein
MRLVGIEHPPNHWARRVLSHISVATAAVSPADAQALRIAAASATAGETAAAATDM